MSIVKWRRAMLFGIGLLALIIAGCVSGEAGIRFEIPLERQVDEADKLEAERVSTPIRSTRGGVAAWVPNPDGETYDVLLRFYSGYWGPHTWVIIDLASSEMKKDIVESALFQAGTIAPDGRYFGHRTGSGGTAIYIYDPASNEFSVLPEVVPMHGETRPLVVGTDGKLYGAGSRNARATAYQLDPETGEINFFGEIGPSHAPNDCWGYSVAADDRFIYVASGKVPWHLLAYDRQSGETNILHTIDEPKGYIGVSQERYGCSAVVRGDEHSTRYYLYEGRMIPVEGNERPWKVPAQQRPWVVAPPRPEAVNIAPNSEGWGEFWFRTPEAKAAAPANAADDADPRELGWRLVRYQVPTTAAHVHRVMTMEDGRIFGSSGNYMGNFIHDPQTDQTTHLGTLSLSHYCSATDDGLVYMSGYPSSALYVYDPDRPWTVGAGDRPGVTEPNIVSPESNPRRVSYLAHEGSGAHKMWTAAVGADGKIYFGGRWYRDGEGGGFGWWDSITEKGGGMAEPFSNYQIGYIAAVDRGRYIAISTQGVRDQTHGKPTPETGRIFIFDTEAGKIVRHIDPVPQAQWAGPIAGVGGDYILGMTYDPEDRIKARAEGATEEDLKFGLTDRNSLLYKINVATGEIVWLKRIPYPVGFRTNENFARQDGFDFRLGPDGKVWTFTAGRFEPVNPNASWHHSYLNPALVRIDPKDGSIDVVGRLDRAGEMAFSGGDLYLSGGCKYLPDGEYLRRISDIVPEYGK